MARADEKKKKENKDESQRKGRSHGSTKFKGVVNKSNLTWVAKIKVWV
jgi:hypothetical protein